MEATQFPIPSIEQILSAKCGEPVRGFEGPLIVSRRENIGEDGSAEFVLLTTDGRSKVDGWHQASDGPEGEWVFFERWTSAGRVSHGWIDAHSRKLLQAG